jgi:hypothetical protein
MLVQEAVQASVILHGELCLIPSPLGLRELRRGDIPVIDHVPVGSGTMQSGQGVVCRRQRPVLDGETPVWPAPENAPRTVAWVLVLAAIRT